MTFPSRQGSCRIAIDDIETFLGSLQRVAEASDSHLTNEVRAALETALRYFKEAASKHTADEEESLFPRLKFIAVK